MFGNTVNSQWPKYWVVFLFLIWSQEARPDQLSGKQKTQALVIWTWPPCQPSRYRSNGNTHFLIWAEPSISHYRYPLEAFMVSPPSTGGFFRMAALRHSTCISFFRIYSSGCSQFLSVPKKLSNLRFHLRICSFANLIWVWVLRYSGNRQTDTDKEKRQTTTKTKNASSETGDKYYKTPSNRWIPGRVITSPLPGFYTSITM